jgi:hypothetical protein
MTKAVLRAKFTQHDDIRLQPCYGTGQRKQSLNRQRTIPYWW